MKKKAGKATGMERKSGAINPTGITGLNYILGGDFPKSCFFLVQGDPGSGKTTLALQFLMEGVRRGERTLYVTLSETQEELEMVAASHGWSLKGIDLLELSALENLLRPETVTTVFRPSEMELAELSQMLLDHAHKIRPQRVVFDSLSEFRLIAETPLRYRRQLLNMKREFARHGSTVLLLDDKMSGEGTGQDPHILSLTHGVLEMEQLSPDYGVARRRLRILKLRGTKFREGYHDYLIVTGGLNIFPRLVAAEHRGGFEHDQVSSGIQELDQILGGGLDRGTTTLILGQSGTGKSTLAMQYAAKMASQGEKGSIFVFDETRGIMLARSAALGLRMEKYVEKGTLTVQQVDPAEISPGEFAHRILEAVNAGCKLVVIDSLNGYLNAMPGEKYLNNQLHELCAYLNQQGVLTILIVTQHGMVTAAEAPVDLSYLSDTVITIRYFETGGEIKQALTIIKKRSGNHEKSIREFRLDPGHGIRVGVPLKEFQGVLTGLPVFHGKGAQIMEEMYAGKLSK